MDYRLAEFVRTIDPSEQLEALVDEAKSETWTKGREHAVLVLARGEIVLVRGGYDGIELLQTADGNVVIEINGISARVIRLAWHTHPRPTGPSDHDRALLVRLNQPSSILFEIGGELAGTFFTARVRRSSL